MAGYCDGGPVGQSFTQGRRERKSKLSLPTAACLAKESIDSFSGYRFRNKQTDGVQSVRYVCFIPNGDGWF
jgi:hypothetical protein